jgi:hypothetical protein
MTLEDPEAGHGALLLWAALSFALGGATVQRTVTNSVPHAGIAGVDVRLRKGEPGPHSPFAREDPAKAERDRPAGVR